MNKEKKGEGNEGAIDKVKFERSHLHHAGLTLQDRHDRWTLKYAEEDEEAPDHTTATYWG